MLGLKMSKSLGLFFAFAVMLTTMLCGFQTTASAATPAGGHDVSFGADVIYEHTTEVSGDFWATNSYETQYTVQITQDGTEAEDGDVLASVVVPVNAQGSYEWTVTLPEGTSFSTGTITVELLDSMGMPFVEPVTDTREVLATPPAPELTVQEVGAYSDTIAGTATAGSEISISVNDGTPETFVTLDEEWIQSFDTPLAEGDMVTVTAVKDTVETTKHFEVKATSLTLDEPKPGDTVVTGSYSNLPATVKCEASFGVNMDFLTPTSVSTMEDSLNGDFTSGTFSIDLIFGGETYVLQVGDEVELVLSDNAYDPAAASTTVYAYASQVVESVDGTTPPPVDGTTPPPADGTTPPPADGTTPPPADGTTPPPTDSGTNPDTFGSGIAIFAAASALAGAGLVTLKRRN